MEVMLAAARKEVVQNHLNLLQQAGVRCSSLSLEPVALANAWEISGVDSAEPVVLIHLGARGTSLLFLAQKRLQFTRELPLRGEVFMRAVSERLKIDASQAERIKCEPGGRKPEVQAALQPAWEEWLTQCRASLDFYENQFGRAATRIFLSGGSVRMEGWQDWIGEATGLPVEFWNPLSALQSTLDPQSLKSQAQILGVAVGLAVAELN